MARTLLTGVTGRVGAAVADDLVRLGAPRPQGLVRTQTAVSAVDDHAESLNYHPVAGDLDDIDSLQRAMRGVDRALLVSNVHPEQCRLQGNFVDAAAAIVDPPHLVKVSGLGSFPNSAVDSGRWHATTEAYIRSRKLSAHCLHPYFFMQNFAFSLPQVKETGILRSGVDGDTPIAMVDLRDIAAVAARLLLEPTRSPETVLPLTSNRSYTHHQVAQLLSQLLDQQINYKVQSARELRRALEAAGQPAWHIDIILQFNAAFDAGLAGQPSTHVATVLGQTPRTLEDYLSELSQSDAPTTGRNPFPNA